MLRNYLKALLLPLFVAAGFLLQPGHARAGLLNGNFSQGGDGLQSWQVTDGWSSSSPGDPLTGQVIVSGGVATMLDPFNQSFTIETDLFQVFTIGDNVQSLSFTINGAFSDSTNPLPSGEIPDSFGASLIYATTGNPLLPAVAGSDSFYTNDITPGITSAADPPELGSMVTLTGGPFPNTVTISGLSPFDGQTAVILFRIIEGSTSENSTISISDVVENTSSSGGGGPPATPEPSSFALIVLASLGLMGYRWRKRVRAGNRFG